jgi:hypothetical protein
MSSDATAERTRWPSRTRRRRARAAGLAAALLVAVAGTSSGAMASAPSASSAEAPSNRATLPAGTHWIGVRAGRSGGTELYDRRTGKRFVPRGVNLLRAVHTSAGGVLNLLLDPFDYQAAWVDRQLSAISRLGYNTVRVFLDHCPGDCLIQADGTLKPAYLDILTTFLTQARDHGLVVLLTENDIVGGPRYGDALPCCDPFGGYLNSLFLTGEGLNIARTFWRDLIGGLQSRGAPLEAVLAYSLQNEQFTLPLVAPFTLTSGLVTTGNGQTYDMGSPAAKIDMAEDNVIYWANNVTNTIRDLDPTTLVTMGFFAPFDASVPAATLLTFERLVRTKRFLHESNVDFFDFHAYPALDLTLPQIVAHYGMAGYTARPIVMGELGAFKVGYPTARTGGTGLVDWQLQSCPLGFDGWLTWSWGWDDPDIYNATDEAGAIAKALAPSRRPNPCSSPPLAANLALGRPVAVSGTFGGEVGSRAVDGLALTGWNSGGGPPGTIQVDLGSGQTIREVRLLVAQDPAGTTTHQIQVRNANGAAFFVVAALTGATQGEQWLRWFPKNPLHGIRWVRIVTTASPSWVAWSEFQVY